MASQSFATRADLRTLTLIRRHGALANAVHCAFDLIELNGEDLRRQPMEERKWRLANLLDGSHLSLVLNEHYEEDGAILYREACKLGCEGIVSKRLGSTYHRDRSPHWVKGLLYKRASSDAGRFG